MIACVAVGVVGAIVAAPVVAVVAVGAVVGAVGLGASAAISTSINEGQVDWQAVGDCALVGGVAGGIISGASYGATKAVQAIAAKSSAGKAVEKKLVSDNINMDKISEHVFSKDHVKNGIMNLGKSKSEILDKFFDVAKSTSDKWVEGSNEIRTIINGSNTTIRFYVENGVIINLDGFVGFSSKVIGTLISLL